MEFLQSVGILDLIFISIIVISILVGLIRGAVREVLSLVGLAAAIYLAFRFADEISKAYISQFFEQPRISYLVAFILIIIITIFVIALVNLLISQLLKASGLSFVNRFFGLIFGALRGAVICVIIVMVIRFIPGATQENWWKDSALAPFFATIAGRSFDYLPKDIIDYFKEKTTITPDKTNAVATDNQTTNQGQMRPEKSVKTQVNTILESIDSSLKDTQPATAEPAAAPADTDNSESRQNNNKTKLVLESYQ